MHQIGCRFPIYAVVIRHATTHAELHPVERHLVVDRADLERGRTKKAYTAALFFLPYNINLPASLIFRLLRTTYVFTALTIVGYTTKNTTLLSNSTTQFLVFKGMYKAEASSKDSSLDRDQATEKYFTLEWRGGPPLISFNKDIFLV